MTYKFIELGTDADCGAIAGYIIRRGDKFLAEHLHVAGNIQTHERGVIATCHYSHVARAIARELGFENVDEIPWNAGFMASV